MNDKDKRYGFKISSFILVVGLAGIFFWPFCQTAARAPKTPGKLSVAAPVLNLQESFANVAERIKPSVVSITTVQIESYYQVQPHQFYFGDPFEEFFRDFYGEPRRSRSRPNPKKMEKRKQGMGSGVIVDERGYILTNEHVIRGADELTVTILEPEEVKYKGKVVGSDPRTDLAIVKIQPTGPIHPAVLGDSDKIRVGDWSIAVGSPFGLEQTVTAGIISAVRQSLNIEGLRYRDFLQTDAAINQGNSGGPLINIHGEVIGINTAIYAPTGVFAGIGFAIPSNRVKEIMNQLIEKGRVVRGWMGVEIMPVNDVLAHQFNLPSSEGILINRVIEGSPAQKAGLQRGDVIVSYNGKPTPNQQALIAVVGRTPPKKKVKLTIIRGGQEKTVSFITSERPVQGTVSSEKTESPPVKKKHEPQEWEGAQFMTLTPHLAKRFSLHSNQQGVVVVDVSPGGLAEKMSLIKGDLVISINRQKTPNVSKFIRAAKKSNPKKGILLDVYRQGKWIYLSYKDN